MNHDIAKIVEARKGWSFTRILPRRTWWWVEIGWNNEILCTSETYSSREKRDQTGEKQAAQLRVPYIGADEEGKGTESF